jgi:hypothetical protein
MFSGTEALVALFFEEIGKQLEQRESSLRGIADRLATYGPPAIAARDTGGSGQCRKRRQRGSGDAGPVCLDQNVQPIWRVVIELTVRPRVESQSSTPTREERSG